MAYRSGYGRGRPAPPSPGSVHAEVYKLVTIEPAHTPEGCVGRDWFVYRISQGKNMITGYRNGDLIAATAEVQRIVFGLNERYIVTKGRPGPKPKAAAAAVAVATVAPVAPLEADVSAGLDA